MRYVHNLSYNDLNPDAISLLSASGLIDQNCAYDTQSRLPYISRDHSPEEIRKAVSDAVEKLSILESDVVVVGGVPDVVYYVAQAVPLAVPVLAILGKKIEKTMTLVGFREIVRQPDDGTPFKAIHIRANQKRRRP